jgi:hypothetical protein
LRVSPGTYVYNDKISNLEIEFKNHKKKKTMYNKSIYHKKDEDDEKPKRRKSRGNESDEDSEYEEKTKFISKREEKTQPKGRERKSLRRNDTVSPENDIFLIKDLKEEEVTN